MPGCRVSQSLLGHQTDSGSRSPSSPDFNISALCKSGVTAAPSGSTSTLPCVSQPQSQWISFADELLTIRYTSTDKETQRLYLKTENACLASSALLGNSSEDQSDLFNNTICLEQLFIEETGTAAEISPSSSSALLDYSLVSSCAHANKGTASMHCVLLFANNWLQKASCGLIFLFVVIAYLMFKINSSSYLECTKLLGSMTFLESLDNKVNIQLEIRRKNEVIPLKALLSLNYAELCFSRNTNVFLWDIRQQWDLKD